MFALADEPISYQLSVHFRNYQSHYGKGSFARDFNAVIAGKEHFDRKRYGAMNTFIAHYGELTIRRFMTEILSVKAA